MDSSAASKFSAGRLLWNLTWELFSDVRISHLKSANGDDFDAQANRMLLNISALLEGQGASFSDVVSAITYVKQAKDADRLRAIFQDAGFSGFPIAMVEATVCRPELLCETEALALLPTDTSAS